MNKKIIFSTLITVGLILVIYSITSSSSSLAFEEWKKNYQVNWSSQESNYRSLIFEANYKLIQKHNSDPNKTYKMGINQFTVYTDEQFVELYLSPMGQYQDNHIIPTQEIKKVEADIDWVAQGKVSAIKNQGQCGSCWAFSATGVCQSWSLINGKSVSLSQQQLVDCSSSYGNHGCNGGWPKNALSYIKDKGILSQSEYPYKAKTNTCVKQGGQYKINSMKTTKGCNGLQSSLASNPISITVDATNWSKYSSGIFSNCGSNINHAVLLVGLSSSYWKVKNSWSTSWGEQGYIRLAMGNTCGMCNLDSPWPA